MVRVLGRACRLVRLHRQVTLGNWELYNFGEDYSFMPAMGVTGWEWVQEVLKVWIFYLTFASKEAALTASHCRLYEHTA